MEMSGLIGGMTGGIGDMIRQSLYREATYEIRRYQNAKSKAADDASREWNRQHWWDWARERWLEHVKGKVFWIELGENDFDLVNKGISDNNDLINCILDRIEDGQENLDIVNWAASCDEDMDEVLEILAKLDLNGGRDDIRNSAS